MMRRTVMHAITIAIALPFAAGCGSRVGPAAAPPTSAAATGPLVLAQFDNGIGAIAEGSHDPVWTDPGAVAALDGSAVFSIRRAPSGDELTQLDPDTGSAVSTWPLPADTASIGAVSPGGRWVALTDGEPAYLTSPPRAATRLVVFDAANGAETHRFDLTGDVRPEAFSVNGQLVFALDYRGDHYRVQTVELATGEQYDTGARDKSVEREDMHGTAVRGVLSRDHTLLATLYRNPGDGEEPAFVHILDLRNGWAYCADLPAPFGTGPAGSDRIELTPAGTAVVTSEPSGRIAEIHIEEVHEPSARPVTVEYRTDTVATSARPFVGTPGFGHVIAALG